MDSRCLSSLLLISLISFSVGDFLFEKLLDQDSGNCEAGCRAKYAKNEIASDVNKQETYCCRGCRLLTILSSYERDLNQSKNECDVSCKEAHKTAEDAQACCFGCNKQVESMKNVHKKLDEVKEDDALQMMYPLIYFNNWCNDVMEQMMSDMQSFSMPEMSSFSLSIYKSDENDGGKLVVIQSEPHFIEVNGDDNFMTSYFLETNLDKINNAAATPKIRPPIMNSLVQRDMNVAIFPHDAADWLDCVSEKTGLSRMFLSFVIFSCSIAIIWLCLTTVATAPETKVETEKLSICGDEYSFDGIVKSGLESVHPKEGDENESPLPFKVPVQKI